MSMLTTRLARLAAARATPTATATAMTAATTRAPRLPCLTLTRSRRRFATGKPSAPSSSPSATAPGKVTSQMVVREGAEILKLMIGGVVVVTGLLVSSGFVIETMKQVNPKPAPGRFLALHDAAGHSVNVHVQQWGAPHRDVAVLLDGGVGEASFDWDKLAMLLAPHATVIAIDRPGLGFSAPASDSAPRTADQIAREYREVLTKLNAPRQVILVGHGAGGYSMRRLAQLLAMEPDAEGFACRGLVLVDALQEELRGELESVSAPVQRALRVMDENGAKVERLARIGLIRLISTVQHAKNALKYSAEALPFVEYYAPTPAHRAGANAENAALPLTEQSFRDQQQQQLPLQGEASDVPCVVLSHGRPDLFTGLAAQPGVDAAAIQAMETKWQEAQRRLALQMGSGSSSGSGSGSSALQLTVADAGHCIHHEQPEAIARVVQALLQGTRHEGDGDALAALAGAAPDGVCPIDA